MLVEQGVTEPRDALRAGHVGPGHEPAQAAPADLAASQQDEPRAAGARADAAEVLLDRIAMAGEPGPVGAGPGGPAVLGGLVGRVAGGSATRRGLDRRPWGARRRDRRSASATSARTAWRDDDPGWIRHGRIEQFDLGPDDRMQPGIVGCGRESDRAVQAVV